MHQFISSLNAKPFVQKLRAFEERRMARLSVRHKQLKDDASIHAATIDKAIKESLKETLKDHADDVAQIVDLLDDEE